ncbi:MAG: PIN domain-containing protein [Verrucomicrobiales bacterium]|nr:PIN domain-containing protein [Verrucomicrobiales bacterium]
MSVRAVIDTNVLIAGKRSQAQRSPNREIQNRWRAAEFLWLYSRDTVGEYAMKLLELGFPRDEIRSFLSRLIIAGEAIEIVVFHEKHYPTDPDDIAFFLCAINGNASHLVTYDSDYNPVRGRFDFRVCEPVEFLRDLRTELN